MCVCVCVFLCSVRVRACVCEVRSKDVQTQEFDKNARCGYLSLVLSKPSRALHTVEPDENMYGPDACL